VCGAAVDAALLFCANVASAYLGLSLPCLFACGNTVLFFLGDVCAPGKTSPRKEEFA
jgi:hypothetical protein